jgi:hypothetical protein
MRRVYHFSLKRQPEAAGLNFLYGTVEAHDVKDARRQVDEIVSENARVGLMKGQFLLSMRTDSLVLKDRFILIESQHSDEYVGLIDGPSGKTLIDLLT